MNSVATRSFLALFHALPRDVLQLAIKNDQLWFHDPHHPSLHLRHLQGSADRFSVRVGDHYLVVGRVTADTITWVWIGRHTEYDRGAEPDQARSMLDDKER